jgi:hypothetical protein
LAHSNIENGLEFDRGLLDNNGNVEEKTLYAPRYTNFVLNSVLTGADQLALSDINTAMLYSNNVPAVVDSFTAYKVQKNRNSNLNLFPKKGMSAQPSETKN